ncbi:hemagglutinin repeat-containing protein [Propionispira raffinosivorans]|uniref:hemagglutinin repeat-containing protein n=1 Tax=Propionispira raffinosivorans TaxID=86959 RepID=UPI00036DD1CC|nr:hemagglutinin repeat-containing protein [Propionispira raffinosivorans]
MTTTTLDKLDQTTSIGTSISGDRVNLQAGQNIEILGSSVVGTNDVNLAAKDNITIAAAQENKTEKNMRQEKKSGLMGSGFGFTIGTEMQKNTLDGTETTQAKSTVGSVQGNVNIKAGKDVTIQASDVISGQNTKIIGANVNITDGLETSHEKQSYEYSKSGLTVYVSSPAIDTIQSISNKVDRASEVGDKRLAALYAVQAVQALSGLDKKINNTVNGATTNDGKKVSDISLNVSLGSTSKTQNSTNDTTQAKGSQISGLEKLMELVAQKRLLKLQNLRAEQRWNQ